MTKSEKLAYLAAAIDGEGSIMFLLRSRKELKRCRTYRPKLEIANTSKEWIEALQKMAGCGYTVQMTKDKLFKDKSRRCKDQWTLMLDSPYPLLKRIKKFLILKRPQAEALTEYYKIIERHKKNTKSRWTEEEHKIAIKTRELIMKLNQRGQSL